MRPTNTALCCGCVVQNKKKITKLKITVRATGGKGADERSKQIETESTEER